MQALRIAHSAKIRLVSKVDTILSSLWSKQHYIKHSKESKPWKETIHRPGSLVPMLFIILSDTIITDNEKENQSLEIDDHLRNLLKLSQFTSQDAVFVGQNHSDRYMIVMSSLLK